MMFKRKLQEINTSSMADIAFLLLIFFLVSTTIDTDKGIQRKLAPIAEEPIDIILNKKDVLDIIINSDNQLMVNSEIIALEELKSYAMDFIDNPSQKNNKPKFAHNAIVNLKNTRGTNYDTYMQVQNELAAAYHQLRENEAINSYTKTYRNLSDAERAVVKKKYPIKIVEATIAINE